MSESLAQALRMSLAAGEEAALVRVSEARGSTPREAGAAMLVWAGRTLGTIGGGRLEWEAMARARELLSAGGEAATLSLPLGPEIGQCCGGHVTLRIERAGARALLELETLEADELSRRPAILVFGAGHVGKALVRALALLPYRARWIDERGYELRLDEPLGQVEVVRAPRCLAEVERAPANAAYVILTHSHSLDALLAEAILTRGDFAYLGIIGSRTKRRTFERGFREAGIERREIDRIACPIGGDAVRDKRPEIIAALTAAEVVTALAKVEALQAREAAE